VRGISRLEAVSRQESQRPRLPSVSTPDGQRPDKHDADEEARENEDLVECQASQEFQAAHFDLRRETLP
jgi:hypothetical protein